MRSSGVTLRKRFQEDCRSWQGLGKQVIQIVIDQESSDLNKGTLLFGKQSNQQASCDFLNLLLVYIKAWATTYQFYPSTKKSTEFFKVYSQLVKENVTFPQENQLQITNSDYDEQLQRQMSQQIPQSRSQSIKEVNPADAKKKSNKLEEGTKIKDGYKHIQNEVNTSLSVISETFAARAEETSEEEAREYQHILVKHCQFIADFLVTLQLTQIQIKDKNEKLTKIQKVGQQLEELLERVSILNPLSPRSQKKMEIVSFNFQMEESKSVNAPQRSRTEVNQSIESQSESQSQKYRKKMRSSDKMTPAKQADEDEPEYDKDVFKTSFMQSAEPQFNASWSQFGTHKVQANPSFGNFGQEEKKEFSNPFSFQPNPQAQKNVGFDFGAIGEQAQKDQNNQPKNPFSFVPESPWKDGQESNIEFESNQFDTNQSQQQFGTFPQNPFKGESAQSSPEKLVEKIVMQKKQNSNLEKPNFGVVQNNANGKNLSNMVKKEEQSDDEVNSDVDDKIEEEKLHPPPNKQVAVFDENKFFEEPPQKQESDPVKPDNEAGGFSFFGFNFNSQNFGFNRPSTTSNKHEEQKEEVKESLPINEPSPFNFNNPQPPPQTPSQTDFDKQFFQEPEPTPVNQAQTFGASTPGGQGSQGYSAVDYVKTDNALREKVQQLESENDILQIQLKTSNVKINSLSRSEANQKEANQQLKEQLRNLEQEVQKLQDDEQNNQQERYKTISIVQELEDLQEAMRKQQTNFQRQQNELKQTTDDLIKARGDLDYAKMKEKQLENEIQALKNNKEFDRMRDLLVEKDTQIENLENELRRANSSEKKPTIVLRQQEEVKQLREADEFYDCHEDSIEDKSQAAQYSFQNAGSDEKLRTVEKTHEAFVDPKLDQKGPLKLEDLNDRPIVPLPQGIPLDLSAFNNDDPFADILGPSQSTGFQAPAFHPPPKKTSAEGAKELNLDDLLGSYQPSPQANHVAQPPLPVRANSLTSSNGSQLANQNALGFQSSLSMERKSPPQMVQQSSSNNPFKRKTSEYSNKPPQMQPPHQFANSQINSTYDEFSTNSMAVHAQAQQNMTSNLQQSVNSVLQQKLRQHFKKSLIAPRAVLFEDDYLQVGIITQQTGPYQMSHKVFFGNKSKLGPIADLIFKPASEFNQTYQLQQNFTQFPIVQSNAQVIVDIFVNATSCAFETPVYMIGYKPSPNGFHIQPVPVKLPLVTLKFCQLVNLTAMQFKDMWFSEGQQAHSKFNLDLAQCKSLSALKEVLQFGKHTLNFIDGVEEQKNIVCAVTKFDDFHMALIKIKMTGTGQDCEVTVIGTGTQGQIFAQKTLESLLDLISL